MAFCSNCGTHMEDGERFCTSCGQPQPQPQPPVFQPAQPNVNAEQPRPVTPQLSQQSAPFVQSPQPQQSPPLPPQQQSTPPAYNQPPSQQTAYYSQQPQQTVQQPHVKQEISQQQKHDYSYPQAYPPVRAAEKKKSKTPFIIAGVGGLALVALVIVLIVTKGFGLLGKTGGETVNSNAVSSGESGAADIESSGNTGGATETSASDQPGDNLLAITEGLNGLNDVLEFMDSFEAGMSQFRELSDEYSKAGLFIQANWFDSLGAASACALRLYIDSLIDIKGGVIPPEENTRLSGWDEIGLLNIASPFPWAFESFTLRADGREADAEDAWYNAIENPLMNAEFSDTATLFEDLSISDLLSLRAQAVEYEDELLDAVGSYQPSFERVSMGWSDGYYLEKGVNVLKADETNYYGALIWFRAALDTDPFDPQNFYLCALMCLEMDDVHEMFYYLEEGIRIAPDDESLNAMIDALVKVGESE